jgi:hypothetical protein
MLHCETAGYLRCDNRIISDLINEGWKNGPITFNEPNGHKRIVAFLRARGWRERGMIGEG